MQLSLTTSVVVIAALVGSALAESHTVHFANLCGFGTPILIQGPNVLSTGGDYTSNGPLTSTIAYLQTGNCGFNGEGCTLIETTLRNQSSSVSGSLTDISLVPPHSYSVTTGFRYFGGCDGSGAVCDSPDCSTAKHGSNDTSVPAVPCEEPNVNLVITFCDLN